MRSEGDVQASLAKAKAFVEVGIKQILQGQIDEQHGVSPSPGATALATLALLALGRGFEAAERKGGLWLLRQRGPAGWDKFPGGPVDPEISRLAQTVLQASQGGLVGRIALIGQVSRFSEMILSLGEHLVPGLKGPEADEIVLPQILERRVLEKLPPYGRPVVVAASLLGAANNQTGVKEALEFLVRAQMQDGSWAEDIVATSLGIVALLRFRAHWAEARRAGLWLVEKQYSSGAWPAFNQLYTWSVGWALNILGSKPQQAVVWHDEAVAWLKAGRNADGSYGSTPPFTHPDLDDTAVVLMGLPRSADARLSIDLLKQLQNKDGSWGTFPDFDGEPPEIQAKYPVYIQSPDVTIHAVQALWKHRLPGDESAIARGLQWLTAAQRQDGSLPASWYEGSVYATAQWVELAGKWRFGWNHWRTDRSINRGRKKARDFLLSSQNEDGSWGSSLVETALALTALQNFPETVPEIVFAKGIKKLLSWQKTDGSFQAAYGGIYAKGWNYEEPLAAALTVIQALDKYILR